MGGGFPSYLWQLNRVTTPLFRSRYLMLGVVALLFGTAVLSVNFANEYVALNGETGLTELPSVRSMLARTGLKEPHKARKGLLPEHVAWPAFLKSQFYRIGGMSLHAALTGYNVRDPHHRASLGWQHVLGIVVSGTCLIGLAFVRHKIPWATLVLSGFCWGLPMRHSTAFPHHNFESLFYIGLPLLLFSLVLLAIHRLFGRRLVVGLSVAALFVFVLSSFQMPRIGHNAEHDESQKNMMTDLDVIRKMTAGKVVAVPGYLYKKIDYGLAGTIMLPSPRRTLPRNSSIDFVISAYRDEETVLTPENRQIFLYDYNYDVRMDPVPEEASPLIHTAYREHVFDVYLSDKRLYYVRSPRNGVVALLDRHAPVGGEAVPKPVVADGQAPNPRESPKYAKFFLHVIPVDMSDLPERRKRWKFDNLDFHFEDYRIPRSKRAIAVRELPSYDIARIHTGQFVGPIRLWEAEVSFEEEPDDA